MKTAIVVDSNSGIFPMEGERLGIYVVPMPVMIDGEIRYEGVDISPEEFYRYLQEGREISTSQPAPEDVTRLWDRVLAEGYDAIVHIPMSSGLSSSFHTAVVLAGAYGGKVQVADNHQIAVPQKNAALDALTLARAGVEAHTIKARLEAIGGDSLVYIGVDTLTYLKKGGRITPAAAALGSVLGIKPLLKIEEGQLDAFAKVRGTRQCRARLIEAMGEAVAARRAKGMPVRVAAAGSFVHAEEAEQWQAQIADAFPGENIAYDPLSLSIGAHTGPGAFAMGVSRVLTA